MKGLSVSVEEKAKAYDEALERAKSKIKNDKDHVLYEDDITEIFPELRESEDERVVKAIINVFFSHKDYEVFFGVSVKDILAWLKKQAEQKPADKIERKGMNIVEEVQNRWISVEKEIYIKDPVLAQLKDIKENDVFKGYVVCADHTLTPDVYQRYMPLNNIVSQNRWKPSDEQMEALKYSTYCPNEQMSKVLFELYQDLKKLREE